MVLMDILFNFHEIQIIKLRNIKTISRSSAKIGNYKNTSMKTVHMTSHWGKFFMH